MTGGEILPAVAAAKAVGNAVLGEDEKTKDVVRRHAEGIPAMGQAAQAYAKRVAVKQQVLLRLYQPLGRMVGFDNDYFKSHLNEDLAAKAQGIPDEHLQTPAPTVAIPALMGLSYSYTEPELKEMYLNLLTTASDERVANKAHPAFAEVIKQMTGAEAQALNACLSIDAVESARLKFTLAEGFTIAFPHALNWGPLGLGPAVDATPAYVDNWARLGLVEVSYTEFVSGDDTYDWVVTHPAYVRAEEQALGRTLDFDKGMVRRSTFGAQFGTAVQPPEAPPSPGEA